MKYAESVAFGGDVSGAVFAGEVLGEKEGGDEEESEVEVINFSIKENFFGEVLSEDDCDGGEGDYDRP